MSTKYIQQLVSGHKPQISEAYEIMNSVFTGTVSPSLLASLLTAMKMRGETPEEIAGFALAMRANAKEFSYADSSAPIDLCGTGGDNSSTINISTIASFIAAGAGQKVAKHGNRAITGKCGSADLLEALGCKLSLSENQLTEALNKANFAFFFAPDFHPAMKHATPVRKELGFRTVFNLLGPLTNPAVVQSQIVGTFNNNTAFLLSRAATHLNYRKISIYCSADSFDELFPDKPACVYTVTGNQESTFEWSFEGLTKFNLSNAEGIIAHTAEESKRAFLEILDEGKESYSFSTAVLNAAFALYSSGYSKTFGEAIEACHYSVKSGAAIHSFNEYRKITLQENS